jgi:hypothetical protein
MQRLVDYGVERVEGVEAMIGNASLERLKLLRD